MAKVWRMLSVQALRPQVLGGVRDKGARQFIRGATPVTGYNVGALEQEHRPPSKKEAKVGILGGEGVHAQCLGEAPCQQRFP